MNDQVPSLAFADLLAYTDFLTQRWLNYFERTRPPSRLMLAARQGTCAILSLISFRWKIFLPICCCNKALVQHDVQRRLPARHWRNWSACTRKAHKKLAQYIDSTNEEALQQTPTLGPVTVSNRKTLTQASLHSVHHWAQVAMEVRQAGFPTETPQDIIANPVMK
jgi:hypothetical protein